LFLGEVLRCVVEASLRFGVHSGVHSGTLSELRPDVDPLANPKTKPVLQPHYTTPHLKYFYSFKLSPAPLLASFTEICPYPDQDPAICHECAHCPELSDRISFAALIDVCFFSCSSCRNLLFQLPLKNGALPYRVFPLTSVNVIKNSLQATGLALILLLISSRFSVSERICGSAQPHRVLSAQYGLELPAEGLSRQLKEGAT